VASGVLRLAIRTFRLVRLVTTQSRPRLLVVASTFPAHHGDGTPAFVKDLSVRLGRDLDTVVLVPRVPDAPARETIDGVTVQRFAYFPRRWESLANGAIIENLRASRWQWLQVVPFFLAESIHLRRLIRHHRPDVLHIHWIVPQGVAALVVGRHVPWVVTTLGGDVYALRDPISQWLKRAILGRARAVTTMNKEMRARLIDAGASADSTYVQPLGADIKGVRAEVGITEPIPGRLLFVGRLVEKKGLATLIDAVSRLSLDLGWSLEVIGDGPLRDELQERAAGLPIEFSGAMSRDGLAHAYGRSSIVVVPSVPAATGDQDGLPTVLLEAMGAGRAIVASDIAGIDEALTDGETGLLVPPNDAGALADALATLLRDAPLRNKLGAAAAERSEAFSVEACSQRFLELLTDAATGAAAR
jgi:glycosyltransferase involved in cell wall biosynthesis